MTIDYTTATQQMINLLRTAARNEILPRFGKVTEQIKENDGGYQEVVTEADIKASEFLLDHIRKDFPGSFSEEHIYDDRFNYDLIWEIDPLDGTQEFCSGLADGYGMLAALLQRQPSGEFQPVIGIIYIPQTDTLLYNTIDQQIHYSIHQQTQQLVLGSRNYIKGYQRQVDPSLKLEQFYHRLGEQWQVPVAIVPSGGANALHRLVNGSLNLFILNHDYSKEWDIAMMEPIARSLGGFVCDLQGAPLTYNRKDVFNHSGFMVSLVYQPEEILPYIPKDLIEFHTPGI
jgi:fructose-1,6-bisphosphatase/inositol monophosphatase family enzyme